MNDSEFSIYANANQILNTAEKLRKHHNIDLFEALKCVEIAMEETKIKELEKLNHLLKQRLLNR